MNDKSVRTWLIIIVVAIAVAAFFSKKDDISSAQSKSSKPPASTKIVIAEKAPLAEARIEGTSLIVRAIEGSRSYGIDLAKVELAEPDPRLDGTYFRIEGSRKPPLFGQEAPPVMEKMIVYTRTKEQRDEWQRRIRSIIAPRDVYPDIDTKDHGRRRFDRSHDASGFLLH